MIDRDRVHALAGDQAGLDQLERFLDAVDAELAAMVDAALRIEAAIDRGPGPGDRTAATAIADVYFEEGSG
jgi:hypothetical protein